MTGRKRLWVALVVIVLVLVALTLAVRLARAASLSVRLTPEARTLFARWVVDHPNMRAHEQEQSGVKDILASPERFFAVELREPEHADIAKMVSAAGGVMDTPAVGRWLVESARA